MKHFSCVCLFLCVFFDVSKSFNQVLYFEQYKNSFHRTTARNIHRMQLDKCSSKILRPIKANIRSEENIEVDLKIMQIQDKFFVSVQKCARLTERVSELEAIVQNITSSCVQTIEMIAMEQKAHGIGDIYMDNDFSMVRRPRFVREEIAYIMYKNNILVNPRMHSKQSRGGTDYESNN